MSAIRMLMRTLRLTMIRSSKLLDRLGRSRRWGVGRWRSLQDEFSLRGNPRDSPLQLCRCPYRVYGCLQNYFQTKEEIFLALYEKEYDCWNEDLIGILNGHEDLSNEELADELAKSISKRKQLLKLLSMNNYDMEANSREELLVSFKRAYGQAMENIRACLKKFCPKMTEIEEQNFIYIFFPFMFGIYPYAEVTEKQKKAMKEAEVDYMYQSIYEITYRCL